jgi:hypothetical protein
LTFNKFELFETGSFIKKIMDTREKRLYIPTIQKAVPAFGGIFPVNGLEPP